MTEPLPPPLGSDGHCTGFPDSLGPWDWHECCLVHDAGGSDPELVACLYAATPDWSHAIVLLAVAAMVACRPVYNELQRLGWAK